MPSLLLTAAGLDLTPDVALQILYHYHVAMQRQLSKSYTAHSNLFAFIRRID